MKTTNATSLAALLLICAAVSAYCQGTMTYLSNLDQASAGSVAVGSNSWVAIPFKTGTNPGGYVLDSVQLAMTDASGNPSGFTVYLYTAVGGGTVGPLHPSFNFATLSGSLSPAIGGIFTYTPASNITLSPNMSHFIVITAGTAVSDGAYDLSYTDANAFNSSEGWRIPALNNGVSTASDGTLSHPAWNLISGDYAQFAIDATPVPEPSILSLFGLFGLAFLWHRRKSKVAKFNYSAH